MPGAALIALQLVTLAQDTPPSTDDDPGEVMVVTGTKTPHRLSDATVATEVVTREEIEASGARDAAEILRMHAGIDVSGSYRGQTVELRGLDPKYVLIIVDGQRVTGTTDGAVDLSRFSAEDIEQIEIVKGPASALYGADALGGVIQIRTRRPKHRTEAGFRTRGGTRLLSGAPEVDEVPTSGLAPVGITGLDALDLEGDVGLVRPHYSETLEAGMRTSSAYDLDPSDEDTSGSAWREVSLGDRGEWRFNDDVRLGGDAGYRLRETRGIDPGAGGAVYDLTNLTEDFHAGLAPDALLGATTRLKGGLKYSIYRDQFLQDQRLSDALDVYNDAREDQTEVDTQLDHAFGDRHTTTLGVEGLFDALHSDRLSVSNVSRQRGAVFAQHEWVALLDQGVSRLVILPGLRWDLDTQFGGALSPKLAVRLDPIKTVILRVSYGWGYRAPDFKELYLYFENPTAGYLVEGNPDLRPETSRSADLDLVWDPVGALRFGAAVFRNDIDDLIEPTLVTDDNQTDGIAPYRMENVSRALTEGVELTAGTRIKDKLTLDLGYSYLHTWNGDYDLPLEGRPAHRVTLETYAPDIFWKLEGTLRVAASSRQPYYEDDGTGGVALTWADGFVDLGLRLARPLNDALTLYVGADNLLDAGDAVYNRLPPRLIYLGLNGRWPGGED